MRSPDMLGFPHAISQTPRRRSSDLADLMRWSDLNENADTDDFQMDLCFSVTDRGHHPGHHTGDRETGEPAGLMIEAECIGAVLSDRGDIALTREQAIDLLGADHVAEAERRAAEKYADGMRG